MEGKSLNMFAKKHRLLFYLVLITVIISLSVGILVAAAFLPQAPISENLISSADQLMLEYNGEKRYQVFDHAKNTNLADLTDSVMLVESAAMKSDSLSTIFTNPYFLDHESGDPVPSLKSYVNGEECSTVYYVRYWMGFRSIVRFLLCFFSYFRIRTYVGFAVLLLSIMAVFSVAKHSGLKNAFLLAFSFLLVRPQIVCQTMQYASCFILAFIAMLMVPWVSRHREYEGPFFLSAGMLTMYFDFYTVPLITFGLPILYLELLRNQEQSVGSRIKTMAVDAFAWMFGYVFMWIVKLGLTTVLTPINGFANGLGSFAKRVGIEKDPAYISEYSPLNALKEVWKVFFLDAKGETVIFAALAVLVIVLIVMQLKKRYSFAAAWKKSYLILIGILPFIWFVAASQPVSLHGYFQYRIIIVFFWAVGLILGNGFPEKSSGSDLNERSLI